MQASSSLYKACKLMEMSKAAEEADSDDLMDLLTKEFEMKTTMGLAKIAQWPVDTWGV